MSQKLPVKPTVSLLQGMPYVPAHQTNIRLLFARVLNTQTKNPS